MGDNKLNEEVRQSDESLFEEDDFSDVLEDMEIISVDQEEDPEEAKSDKEEEDIFVFKHLGKFFLALCVLLIFMLAFLSAFVMFSNNKDQHLRNKEQIEGMFMKDPDNGFGE